MASQCLVWSLQRSGSRYALALSAEKCSAPVVWSPGYESQDIGDIVKAIWYLENDFRSDLPEHKLRMLDMIKRQAAAELPDFEIYGM